jgi:hypothetical protein
MGNQVSQKAAFLKCKLVFPQKMHAPKKAIASKQNRKKG